MRTVRVNAVNEDQLLDDAAVSLILGWHGLELDRIVRHVLVNGYEIDAVILARTPERGLRRSIGVELKINDWPKALLQAYARRRLFHYFYVVMGEGLHWGLRKAARVVDVLCTALREGVGIIYHTPKEVVLISASTYNPDGLKLTTLEDYMEAEGRG